MVPAGLLEEQHRPVRAGLHADGHDSHLVHGAPTFSAARLASACVTRTTGPGDPTPTLDTPIPAITWPGTTTCPARLRSALHANPSGGLLPSTQLPMPGAGCPARVPGAGRLAGPPRARPGLVISFTEGRDVLVNDVGDVGEVGAVANGER